MIAFSPEAADGLEYVHANGQHIVTLLELGHDRLRQLVESMQKTSPQWAELRDWSLILSAMEIAIEKAEAIEKAGKAFWGEWDREAGLSGLPAAHETRVAA